MLPINNNLSNACICIDGILYNNPSNLELSNNLLYQNFLSNSIPLIQTNIKLGFLLTTKNKKYKQLISNWLNTNNFIYKKLFFFNPLLEKSELTFKSNILKLSNFNYFYQNNPLIASQLKELFPYIKIYCNQTNTWL